jgi:hypothetical protein
VDASLVEAPSLSLLHSLVAYGHDRLLHVILSEKPHMTSCVAVDGRTLLHTAADFAQRAVTGVLLSLGADLKAGSPPAIAYVIRESPRVLEAIVTHHTMYPALMQVSVRRSSVHELYTLCFCVRLPLEQRLSCVFSRFRVALVLRMTASYTRHCRRLRQTTTTCCTSCCEKCRTSLRTVSPCAHALRWGPRVLAIWCALRRAARCCGACCHFAKRPIDLHCGTRQTMTATHPLPCCWPCGLMQRNSS